MQNKVTTLEIKNFKSIKYLQMNCKRLNVFIGEPNVGKSNILEALGLFSADFSTREDKFLSEFVRYEQFSNLFYDDDLQLVVEVNVEQNGHQLSAILIHQLSQNYTDFLMGDSTVIDKIISMSINDHSVVNIRKTFDELTDLKSKYSMIESNGKLITSSNSQKKNSPFRKYDFAKINFSESHNQTYLTPPYGNNLFRLIRYNSNLKKEITGIFAQRGLDVVFSKTENTIELQKKDADNFIYNYPFSSTADTFQRLVFYLAVIESNKNSVLILEEPEVHSFPPYTTMLAERILEDIDNQYFIATHSPYLLGKLVEKADFDELNICIAYYENYETKVKILNEKELQEVVDYSTDLFFNLSKFTSK